MPFPCRFSIPEFLNINLCKSYFRFWENIPYHCVKNPAFSGELPYRMTILFNRNVKMDKICIIIPKEKEIRYGEKRKKN